jgi:hypothetical protein
MNTSATIESYEPAAAEEVASYRAINTGAIIGFVLGLFSVVMLIIAPIYPEATLWVALIPVLGMFVSLRAWGKIKRESELYMGGKLALAGLLLSGTFLVTGAASGAYVYVTEVPDGYSRISFNDMKPTEFQERGGVAVPPDIADLAGKRVFIKGYIRPDSVSTTRAIDRFLLVRDNNQCCFGDLTKIKYYDQIDVDMEGPLRIDFSQGVFKIGGVLEIQPENVALGPSAPVFSLKADYAN